MVKKIKEIFSNVFKESNVYFYYIDKNGDFTKTNVKIILFFYFSISCFYYLLDLKNAYIAFFVSFLLFFFLNLFEKISSQHKLIFITIVSNTLYCYVDLCYGKKFDFLVYFFITNSTAIIFLRFFKLAGALTLLFCINYFLKEKFNYYGFDISDTVNYEKTYYIWKSMVYFIVMFYLFTLAFMVTNRIGQVINEFELNNKELILSRNRQKELEQIKESFFATISHEIRTPLNAIKGISDLLIKEEKIARSDLDLFEIMNNSSNHLLSLVNNFLDFSKLNEGKFTLIYSDFDFEENINFIFNMNSKLAFEKNLVYEIKKNGILPQRFYADKNRLNQVILNILNNAIKYTDKGSVTLHYGGTYSKDFADIFDLEIKIMDTGIGIHDMYLGSIFETFTNVNRTSEDSVGLGLSISKGLIELMKGKIKVESILSNGSTFTIKLPLKISNEPKLNISKIDFSDKLLHKKLKILIVDDNKINVMVITRQLEKAIKKAEVHVANNGVEAIDQVEKNYYDLILMDLMMPLMGGIEATKIIRRHTDNFKKHTPIIALTANVEEKALEKCYQIGMNDYITKPFDINDLLQKIHNILD